MGIPNILGCRSLGVLLAIACLAQSAGAAEDNHGAVPGVVIDYSPAASGKYIGCPSITILPDGSYVASHSFFGPGTTHDQTCVFGSSDRGKTWKKLSQIDGQFWSNLFVYRGALYIMGPNRQWGEVVIRRSDDGGHRWTTPKDKQSGLLLDDGRYHSSTVPMLIHKGRIWRAMEVEDQYPHRGRDVHPYAALVMSAPLEADLLKAENWTTTNYLRFDLARVGKKPPQRSGGWREGNVLATPDGRVVNLLRIDDAGVDRADILPVSQDGKRIDFDDENWGLIDFPGGRTKFTVRFDPKTKRYWSLVNKQSDPPAVRNVLALTSSADLKHWKVESIVLRHRDPKHHAFQYVDWVFDGDDIVAASRTAYGNSHNFHDANYLTFHRIKDFRTRTMAQSPAWLGGSSRVEYENQCFTITGSGFRIKPLENDALAFGNRKYVWKDVPKALTRRMFTQTDGGVAAEITVVAKRDALLQVATASKQKGTHMTGWTRLDGLEFHYTDANCTPMAVYQKRLTRGNRITVPQTNWSGTLLLLEPPGHP